jgi:hypothetical protein
MAVNEDELFEVDAKSQAVTDIVDANSYSIQEIKIKSEHDREVEEAEKKKQASFT